MATYLKSSDIPGNVTAKGYENTFELLSLSWGVTRNISSRAGKTQADGGVAVISELVCTKRFDFASSKLFSNAFSGTNLSKLTLFLTRQDKSGPITYIQIDLTDVIVSAYSFSAVGGEGTTVPEETFNLNYGSISITNTPPKADGTPGSPSTSGWNVTQNVKL
jgi:type VI secretion system secreted protein Hcp